MFYTINQFISFLVSGPFRRFLFAICFGILCATTLPSIGFELYAWFALIPLLILIKSSESYISTIVEAFVFFMVYNLISFIWMLGIHPLTWHGFTMDQSYAISIAGWLIPSLFHSLALIPFVILTKIFYQFRADNRSNELDFIDMCILAFVWVSIQHKIIPNLGPDFGIFSIPINLLVYSQYQNKVLIQVANAVGAVGLEYFIVVVNMFFSNFFNIQRYSTHISSGMGRNLNVRKPFFGIQNPTENLQYAIVLTVVLSVILVYGIVELESNKSYVKANREKMKSFAAIQADYSTASTRGKNHSPNQLIALQYELSEKIKDNKNLLIWSEGSVPVLDKQIYVDSIFKKLAEKTDLFTYGTYDQKDENIYNAIETIEFKFTQTSNPQINPQNIKDELSGYIDFEQGDSLDFALDKTETNEKESAHRNNTRVLEEILIYDYHKRNLVPFGEYTPLIDYLPHELKSLAESTVGNGFKSETEVQEPVKTYGLNIAYSICFELLFSELIREQTAKDAEIIINLNDLSWFKNFAKGNLLKKQFLAVAVFRAVENKKDLILVGNCGFSALIDAAGKIQLITQPNKIAILQGYFMPRKEKSIYSLYGW